MGKVTWGDDLTREALDDVERDRFKPYDGPPVPNAMYAWRLKVLKRGKAKSSGNTQIIIGLELVPRSSRPEEKPYAGYFITDYISVLESQAFKIAPFLDALGVSSTDFLKRTSDTGEKDDRGSVPIAKIGDYVHDGKFILLASIGDDTDQNGAPRKRITGYYPAPEGEQAKKSKRRDEDDEEEDDEEEERPAKKSKKATATKKRKSEPEPDEDDEEDEPPRKKKAAPAKKKRREPEPDEDEDDNEDEDDDAPF